jgi:N-acetylneuraminic acid mutarotase
MTVTTRLPPLVLLLVSLALGAFRAHAAQPEGCGSDATPSPQAATQAATGTWTELPPMPRPRSELGAAAIDGVIYVVGGFGGSAMVDCLDLATNTWRAAADLPQGVNHPGVAALDGSIYVAGGYTDDGPATDAFWAYDPASDTWKARSPLPKARGALGLVALGGKLYAVGGAYERLGGPVSGDVTVYNPATDTWSPLAAMPTPREHLAVAGSNDRVFAIGGRANGDEGDQFAAAVAAYDPATDTWEDLPPLPTPRGGFAGAFAAGQVVVLGGERGTTTFDAVEAFDPATGFWRSLPPMPTARHGVALVAVGDMVYALAGSTQAGKAENTGAAEALGITPPS